MFYWVILTVLSIQLGMIESQPNPSCVVYDFNDPIILDQFVDCTDLPRMAGTAPLVINSYNESLFEPYHPTSQRFLTTNASLYEMQCLRSKTEFRGTFTSMAFKMGFNLRNSEPTFTNNFQFFVGPLVWAQHLKTKSNGWELYERFYNLSLGDFDNYFVNFILFEQSERPKKMVIIFVVDRHSGRNWKLQ